MTSSCDTIGLLASDYLRMPAGIGLRMVDANIADASARSDWDAVNKWHRVRLRLLRMQAGAQPDRRAG